MGRRNEPLATPAQLAYIEKLGGRPFSFETKYEASARIDMLLGRKNGAPASPEYVAIEYRRWIDNKHAPSGRSPGSSWRYVSGDADSLDIKTIEREAGSLSTILCRTSDKAHARRVMLSHKAGHDLAGAHGHERILKQLAPSGDVELLVDITVAHLSEAVKRKPARSGWMLVALRRWAKDADLLALVGADVRLVIRTLGGSLTPTTTGPEARNIVNRAAETCGLVEEALRQGHPAEWASKLARNKTGVELSERHVNEIVQRMKNEAERVSA